MNFLHTALAFLLALGPLIVFHELGHYWVARLCGVKVLRFSIGMGKVVWSRRVGPDRTEWAISALPLGGYVKMLDARDPDLGPLSTADRAREFNAQSVWKRIAIVAAGPLANFLLAIAVMAGLYMHGVAEPAARVRVASEDTVAWSAGLRGGDLVTAINGEQVGAWSELRMGLLHAVMDHSEARIEVDRPAAGQVTLTVPASTLRGLDVDSDVADKLGLGVWAPKPVLGRVEPGGPAAKAGLRRGDRIATIDGKAIADGIAFVEIVRASPNKPLVMTGERAGQPFSVVVVPSEHDHKGRINAVVEMQPETVTVSSGPVTAIGKAAAKTWDTVTLTLRMIGKMITGEVSWKNVTGPLTIADFAGQTARMGAEVFLGFIAFVSISLGVMNLLPIPVLDGGLLLYYLVEVLTGRPLPERIGEFAQRAGVGLLVTLMALAVFNDVMRLL